LLAFAFAASLLMLTAASAIAQSFGTAEEARAMLDHAVAALKSDKAKALREFNDPDNKQFHDRDLYVSCFNISDGKFTAAPSAMLGLDMRTFNVGDDPIGQKGFRCGAACAGRRRHCDGL
jgi:cytochrome c